jgi:hypothetical protein
MQPPPIKPIPRLSPTSWPSCTSSPADSPPAARRTVVGGGEDRGDDRVEVALELGQVVLGVVGLVEVAGLASVGLSFLILFLL